MPTEKSPVALLKLMLISIQSIVAAEFVGYCCCCGGSEGSVFGMVDMKLYEVNAGQRVAFMRHAVML